MRESGRSARWHDIARKKCGSARKERKEESKKAGEGGRKLERTPRNKAQAARDHLGARGIDGCLQGRAGQGRRRRPSQFQPRHLGEQYQGWHKGMKAKHVSQCITSHHHKAHRKDLLHDCHEEHCKECTAELARGAGDPALDVRHARGQARHRFNRDDTIGNTHLWRQAAGMMAGVALS